MVKNLWFHPQELLSWKLFIKKKWNIQEQAISEEVQCTNYWANLVFDKQS